MISSFKTLVFVVALVAMSGMSASQDYAVMPINESFDIEKIMATPEANGDAKRAASILRQKLSKQQQNASNAFRSGEINNQFKAYFNQVIIPGLTRYDKQSLATLNERHRKLVKDLATRVRNQKVYVYLITEVFFPKLSEIVDGNYHPAVRYNAIVTLGKLDEVVGKQRTAAPTPYRKVLPFLIQKYNEFNDPKLAYLKYGALKGIARIATIEFQKPNSTADAAKPVLAALLGPKPANIDADMYEAMQKNAVIALGKLGDPANFDSLASLLKNEQTSIWTRVEAAVAISNTKTPTIDATKLEPVGQSMAKFMHDVLRQESDRLEYRQRRVATLAARKKEVASGGANVKLPGMGGKKGGGSDPFDGDGPVGGMGGGDAGAMRGKGSGGAKKGPGGFGGKSGKSKSKKNAVEIEELPEYQINIARRRVKTIALGLHEAFGSTSSTSKGILRWANSDANLLKKLGEYKKLIEAADAASETGIQSAVVNKITDSLQAEFNQVADQIAQALGLNPAKSAKSSATAKSGSSKKKPGGSFVNK